MRKRFRVITLVIYCLGVAVPSGVMAVMVNPFRPGTFNDFSTLSNSLAFIYFLVLTASPFLLAQSFAVRAVVAGVIAAGVVAFWYKNGLGFGIYGADYAVFCQAAITLFGAHGVRKMLIGLGISQSPKDADC